LSNDEEKEKWNGERVRERLEWYLSSVGLTGATPPDKNVQKG
jgi:hypothetical protein